MAKVAAIIANNNYGIYLSDCIESILNQSYETIPMVIDDNSTDDSVEITKSLLKIKKLEFSQINNLDIELGTGEKGKLYRLISKDNNPCGPSISRNIAILNLLTEDFDHFLIADADDIQLENKVEKLLASIKQDVMVAYADYFIKNEFNNIRYEYKLPFSVNELTRQCIVHSSSLIHRKALLATIDQNGVYDNNMRVCEDYDLWIRIVKAGFKIKHLAEPLTIVRSHSMDSTHSVNRLLWEQNWNYLRQKHG